jgi:molybdate transport system ATP-binding protein
MTISVSFKKKLKYIDLDISFSLAKNNMMVMIGPSGGGKTTIIRMLAGLEKPKEGKIVFGDEVWFDSLRRIDVPPQKRRLGYVSSESLR